MLFSMTGYGESWHEDEQIRVGFRIKTVNNKGLDLNIKLPFDFMYLEPELRNMLKGVCYRGRIDVFSEFEVRDPDLKPPTPLNRVRMAQLAELAEEIKSNFPVEGSLDLNTLITMQDLTVTQRVGFRLPPEVEKTVRDAFKKALENLSKSRNQEGEKLRTEMHKWLEGIGKDAAELASLAENRREEMAAAIRQRVEALMTDNQVDEARLTQEVVYYADRLDISEEIARLKAHSESMDKLLDSGKRPIGKELDFLIQEQMREVTTIGNKAKHRWIADKVVRLKTDYEKIREQVQNVE